jgi:hypothetical protein
MWKYVVPVLLCVSCWAQEAAVQAKVVSAKYTAAQKAAQREAANNEVTMNPQEQLERAVVADVIAQRHAQLQRDTEKLVALTAELKQHVDKAGANILSMDVVKKAAEIQKLAKSVEEKMKNAY